MLNFSGRARTTQTEVGLPLDEIFAWRADTQRWMRDQEALDRSHDAADEESRRSISQLYSEDCFRYRDYCNRQ